MNVSYSILRLLVFLPMLAGTSLFIAWYTTRSDALLLLGGYALLIGGLVVILTIVLLFVFIFSHKKYDSFTLKRKKQVMLVVGFSVFNVILAFGYAYLVAQIALQINVKMINESGQIIEMATLIGPSQKVELGPLSSGQEVESTFNPKGEGRVELSIRTLSHDKKAIIVGYVPAPNGANISVTVDKNMEIHVSEND